jgi:hypothetical protein
MAADSAGDKVVDADQPLRSRAARSRSRLLADFLARDEGASGGGSRSASAKKFLIQSCVPERAPGSAAAGFGSPDRAPVLVRAAARDLDLVWPFPWRTLSSRSEPRQRAT